MRALSLLCLALIAILVAPPFAASQESVVTPEELYAGGPNAPVITSSTHSDPERWYKGTNAEFSWELPVDATAVAVGVATSSGKEPMQPYRPPVSSITLGPTELTEGINYLTVQFRNFEKWGMYSERTVRIDNTPPSAPSLSVSAIESDTENIRVMIESHDALSGISYYDLNLNNQPTKRLTVSEAAQGYKVALKAGKETSLRAVAYDQAGNSSETSLLLWPTPYKPPMVGLVEEEPASFLLALMASLIILLFGYLVYERLRYARALASLRKETAEVHNQLIRIFTALREEIYDQIRGISKKSRVTKGEQRAVDGLNQALAVSESLIEKEVADVKKLLEK